MRNFMADKIVDGRHREKRSRPSSSQCTIPIPIERRCDPLNAEALEKLKLVNSPSSGCCTRPGFPFSLREVWQNVNDWNELTDCDDSNPLSSVVDDDETIPPAASVANRGNGDEYAMREFEHLVDKCNEPMQELLDGWLKCRVEPVVVVPVWPGGDTGCAAFDMGGRFLSFSKCYTFCSFLFTASYVFVFQI